MIAMEDKNFIFMADVVVLHSFNSFSDAIPTETI
jgi:hypothetical protein